MEWTTLLVGGSAGKMRLNLFYACHWQVIESTIK